MLKKITRITSMLLVSAMLVTAFPARIFAAEAKTWYNSGENTSGVIDYTSQAQNEASILPVINLPDTDARYDDSAVEASDEAAELTPAEADSVSVANDKAYAKYYTVEDYAVLSAMQDYGGFSSCPENIKNKIIEYVASGAQISAKAAAEIGGNITALEADGYNLYESAVILRISVSSGGCFNTNEAARLFTSRADRTEREKELAEFKKLAAGFATYLTLTESVSAEALPESILPMNGTEAATSEEEVISGEVVMPGETTMPGEMVMPGETLPLFTSSQKAAYLSADNFTRAKALFLEGHSVSEIAEMTASAAVSGETLINFSDSITASDDMISPDALAKDSIALAPEMATDIADASVSEQAEISAALTELFPALMAASSSNTLPEHPEYLSAPYMLSINANENVNIGTGEMRYREELFSIPGINGLDLDVSLVYSSTLSNIGIPLQSQNSKKAGNFVSDTYHFGVGWTLGMPWIELYSDTDSMIVLHMPGGASYKLSKGTSNYTFENYNYTDMSFSYVASAPTSYNAKRYEMTDANGVVHEFNKLGQLIKQTDRYGNVITYTYNETTKKLSSITDTAGKAVSFSYTNTSTGYNVTITKPDNTTITLVLTEVETSAAYSNGYYTLSQVIHGDGKQTSFTYTRQGMDFDFNPASQNQYNKQIFFYSLSNITSQTGESINYQYTSFSFPVGSSSGYVFFPSVSSCSSSNGSYTYTYNTVYSEGDGSYGDPQLYLTRHDITKVTQNNGVYTVYTFHANSGRLLTEQTFFPGTDPEEERIASQKSYEYVSGTLPGTVITKLYNPGRPIGKPSSTSYEFFEYDTRKNITKHVAPQSTNSPNNSELTETAVYSTYNLPSSKTYWLDSSAATVTNMITGKSITQTTTSHGGSVKAKSEYTYNIKGQITQEKIYTNISSGTYITQNYSYTGANLTSKTVTGIVNADGAVQSNIAEQYGYNTMGNRTSVTNPRGNTTSYSYDRFGRITGITNPDGGTASYVYNNTANTVKYTEYGKTPVVYVYDSAGRLISERLSSASGQLLKSCTYDNRGRLTSETTTSSSTAGGTVYYTYDLLDRLLTERIVNTSGSELYKATYSYTYASYASLFSTLKTTKTVTGDSSAAAITDVTYESTAGCAIAAGVKAVQRNGVTVSEQYLDMLGNATRERVDNGSYLNYTYDIHGNVVTMTNALGDTASSAYDAAGRKTSETDYRGNSMYYTYDNAGRMIKSTDKLTQSSDNQQTKYYYDANGNLTKTISNVLILSTEDEDEIKEYTYDSMNRLTDTVVYVTSSSKLYTHYTYNTAGQILKTYSGMSSPYSSSMPSSAYQLTQNTYNSRGFLTAVTDALGNVETYTYDVLGYMLTKTARDGKQTRFTYNSLGKISSDKVYASASASSPLTSKTYTYTKTGEVAQISENGSTLSYTYNSAGLVSQESENAPGGGSVSGGAASRKQYTYDGNGNLTAYSLYVGTTLMSSASYSYDNMLRLISTTEGNTTVTYEYDENGNRTRTLTKNGSTVISNETVTYDKHNRVKRLSRSGATFTYVYNAIGNQTSKTENYGGSTTTTTYTYDRAGRLTQETCGSSTISYVYDAAGNRTSMTENGTTTTYTYDKNNRLLSEVKGGTTTSHTYDLNGNTLTKGSAQYTYNARGQQTGYMNGTTTAMYAYNPNGLRNVKTTNNSTRFYVWSGSNIVYEYTASASIGGTKYTYGLMLIKSGGEYYLFNGHGDVVQLANTSGTVTKTYRYNAFGEEQNILAADTNPFRYCGQYYDVETGTIYLRARYYDPDTGRFTQEDDRKYSFPQNLLSYNLYAYCLDNPVSYMDYTGNFVIALSASALYGIGLLISACILIAAVPIIEEGTKEICKTVAREERRLNTQTAVDHCPNVQEAKYKVGETTKVASDVIANADIKNKKSPRIHHIVAQTASLAKPAQKVLSYGGMSVHDPQNLVVISKEAHASIHTNNYYNYVNHVIAKCYVKGNPEKTQKKVRVALVRLQIEIVLYSETGKKTWDMWALTEFYKAKR